MSQSLIRILLANHQPILRSGLRFLIEHEPGFQVVAEAANGREAIVLTDYKRPDIALLEMKLPLVDGLEVSRQISSKGTVSKPIFVTDRTDESYVSEALKAGARGYVSGDAAPGDLPRAIRKVSQGKYFISPAISAKLVDGHRHTSHLSEYEKALWCLLASAHEQSEISLILKVEAQKVDADSRRLQNLFLRDGLVAGFDVLQQMNIPAGMDHFKLS